LRRYPPAAPEESRPPEGKPATRSPGCASLCADVVGWYHPGVNITDATRAWNITDATRGHRQRWRFRRSATPHTSVWTQPGWPGAPHAANTARPSATPPCGPTRRTSVSAPRGDPVRGQPQKRRQCLALVRPAPQIRALWEGYTGQLLGKKSGVDDRSGEGLSSLERSPRRGIGTEVPNQCFCRKKRYQQHHRPGWLLVGVFCAECWVNIRLKYHLI
jgi:hypothetical protein